MHLKNILVHALLLATAAAHYTVTPEVPDIDWSSSCTDAAIIENWSVIRIQLQDKIAHSKKVLSREQIKQIKKLLGGSWLPKTPDLALEQELHQIIGDDLMAQFIGSTLDSYWQEYPCVYESPESSAPPTEPSDEESPEEPGYEASPEESPEESTEEPGYEESPEESPEESTEEPGYEESPEESPEESTEEPGYEESPEESPEESTEEPGYEASSEESPEESPAESSDHYSSDEVPESSEPEYSETHPKHTVTVTVTSGKCPVYPAPTDAPGYSAV